MGCFFACFGACKHNKRHRHSVNNNATPSADNRNGPTCLVAQLNEPAKQEAIQEPIKHIAESKEKIEWKLNCNVQKKVTFDLDIKAHASLSTEEVTNYNAGEKNEEKESENKEKPVLSKESNTTDLVKSNLGLYPPNHRYKDCPSEEYEEIELGDSDLGEGDVNGDENDGGGDGQALVQEESSESLFSLSIDSRKQFHCGAEMGEKEVTSPMPESGSTNEEVKSVGLSGRARDRTKYIDSVLNPVENLTQWKAVKCIATLTLQHEDKENVNLERHLGVTMSPEPSFKVFANNPKASANKENLRDQETAVDTSLSSWLVESETTPMSKSSANSAGNSPSGKGNSGRSNEDRPILGAMTIEELKQLSASNSPRRARSRSPDETPIIGTVGSYWRHTGQAMDSDSSSSSKGMSYNNKNGEDENVKFNSTPFGVRLERTVNKGIA